MTSPRPWCVSLSTRICPTSRWAANDVSNRISTTLPRTETTAHPLGFPIRKSPDHSLLAASRGLSQLTASFIAYLRQGIHTHALSSLTIKSTSHTLCERYFFALHTCVYNARQYSVVKDLDCVGNPLTQAAQQKRFAKRNAKSRLVGLGRIELPTSPLSGVRSSQLSYRPEGRTPLVRKYRRSGSTTLVELVGIEPATS